MESINLQEKEDSNSVLVRVLLHWKTMLLSAIVGAVLGAALYYAVVDVIPGEPPYTSEATVYLEFEPGTLEAFQYFNAYTWRQIAKSDMVTDLVMPLLPEGYTKEELVQSIWVELKADVRVMTLQIQSDKKERADVMMNAMLGGLAQFGQDRPEFVSIYEIGVSDAKRLPRELLTERAAGLGAVCIFLICLAVLFVKEIVRNAIFVPEECKSKYGIPCEAVFAKDGKTWRENEWDLSREKMKEAVLVATGKEELEKVLMLTGARKGYVYDELDCNMVSELQNADRIYLSVVWGKTSGTWVRHIVSECEKRNITLEAIVLTDADRLFLKKYYGK